MFSKKMKNKNKKIKKVREDFGGLRVLWLGGVSKKRIIKRWEIK